MNVAESQKLLLKFHARMHYLFLRIDVDKISQPLTVHIYYCYYQALQFIWDIYFHYINHLNYHIQCLEEIRQQ